MTLELGKMEKIEGGTTGWEGSSHHLAEHFHKMETRRILSLRKVVGKITLEQAVILDRLNDYANDIYM